MCQPHCEVIPRTNQRNLREIVLARLPEGRFRHIFIKPNWVRHQMSHHFPVEALVTSPDLIAAAIEACLDRYSGLESVTVGDSPVQSCHFGKLLRQTGLDRLAERYRLGRRGVEIRFLDLRCPHKGLEAQDAGQGPQWGGGDPLGWREITLNDDSFLEEISSKSASFRVNDYDPRETVSRHSKGSHRYIISESVLAADLIINLPKAKTHQKAGITGALKNFIGVVGDKSCLVHFRSGVPQRDGDEFPPGTPALIRLHSAARESWFGRFPLTRMVARGTWKVLRRIAGIEVDAGPSSWGKRLYCSGGSWPGNDTIWRMIYDVNRIVQMTPRRGLELAQLPQREQIIFVDAITAGEGNGPLQPLPVCCNTVIAANDPFLCDVVLAHCMGFDWTRIPQLGHWHRFLGPGRGKSVQEQGRLYWDGQSIENLASFPLIARLRPAPGWEGICREDYAILAESA